MKTFNKIFILASLMGLLNIPIFSQETDESNNLKLSGYLMTNQRFLIEEPNDWVWNETRLTLEFDKKITNKSSFYSEVWLRNFGLPAFTTSSQLYNTGNHEPFDIQLRQAYIKVNGFLSKNLDLKIGRQRIAWGKADKMNPTDNLNPYDFEDILDFGRHRASDAVSLDYWFNSDFHLQGIYIPFYKPANLPVGIFSDILYQQIEMPVGLTFKGMTDTLLMPRFNLAESSNAGLKFNGIVKGFDFSLSYVWGRDGLPSSSYNTIIPVDMEGGVTINSKLMFPRTHIFGFDLAGNIKDVGVWAEVGAFLPEKEFVMTTDLSALYPLSPVPVMVDSVMLKKELYVKFVIGADYHFANASYLNFQYLHGFIHECGREKLNDYFFLNYDLKFFEEKLKIRPIGGGFIVSDWKDVKNNYALVYVPEISYMATEDMEITLSSAIFEGKGSNMFSGFSDTNMLMFKVKYSF
jgi:hypothetical protein